MIDGWEEAIKTMRVGERAIVRISDPNLGYGAAGFAPVVPPNAVIELDLEVLDAKARSAIDFDTLAIGDPDTPVSCYIFVLYFFVNYRFVSACYAFVSIPPRVWRLLVWC
jgi:hypothetical protein